MAAWSTRGAAPGHAAASPSEAYRSAARERGALRARQHLLANPTWLSWLAARGLPLDAVVRYRLGWNPGEKGRSCLIRPRASWGLPPLEAKPGQDKPKTTFWIPRGLVIPQLPADPDGLVLRLRIRRPDEDRKQFSAEKKYYVIPGSSMDAMILGPLLRRGGQWPPVPGSCRAPTLGNRARDPGRRSVRGASPRLPAAGQPLCDLGGLGR